MLRIGHGYDLHRLGPERALWLGGVRIPTADGYGLIGHSDADVLLHAIIDAVLGSVALGDIGQWFPDTDPAYLGADSKQFLRRVLEDERLRNWRLQNLDCTIIAERPKLAPHIPAIRDSLAALFQVPIFCISVKAKTNEGMDATGRREAIAAWAVLLAETQPV